MISIMHVAMATAMPFDYTLPLKQGTSFQNAFVNTDCAYVSYLCSLCNYIHIKITETRNILEILFLASLYVGHPISSDNGLISQKL